MNNTDGFVVKVTDSQHHRHEWWNNFMAICHEPGSSQIDKELRPYKGRDIADSYDLVMFETEADFTMFLLRFA